MVIVFAVVAGTLYYFSGKEYVFRFTENQLQEKLDTKLPLTKSYFIIFQVTLDHPRITLINGSKRVNAGLDIILNIRLNNEKRPLGGSLDVSGGVIYLPDKGQFFLTDPLIENLSIQGIPENFTEKANIVLTKALAEFYTAHPIYTLRRTDVKRAVAKLVLKDVVIEKNELVATLGI